MNIDINSTLAVQEQMVAALRQEYEGALTEEMGQLHNQFVSFIATAKIPLPHVALVLDILKQETLSQALTLYLGDKND